MLGILCGLESEAAIARKIPASDVACAAARPGQARALAQKLVEKGARHLVSFGVAGGLKPGLPVGALILATHVVSLKGRWECDKPWNAAFAARHPVVQLGGVWGSEMLVPTADDKRALYEGSACVIVDMESQCAAEIASAARLPFTVVRAVCDTAAMHVPPVVMAAISEDGSVDARRAITHLARRPREIPDLFHVMLGINRALRALKRSLPAF
ncbi:MAG: hypothetical protein M3N08_06040 [Pseudomonadota bacterium]|nr:hypothetical protein [Pseudomonadota bacterium]